MEWSGTFRQEKRIIFFVPYLTRPHVLRHTGCTRMAETGMDPKVLQYLMGHNDITVTMGVYNHISDRRRIEQEINRLDQYAVNENLW